MVLYDALFLAFFLIARIQMIRRFVVWLCGLSAAALLTETSVSAPTTSAAECITAEWLEKWLEDSLQSKPLLPFVVQQQQIHQHTSPRAQQAHSLHSQQAKKTRLPLQTSHGTILPILTADGKRLYFDRKWHPNNTGGEQDFDDIWYADHLPNGTFSEPVNVGVPLNTIGSDVLCSLSPDDALALVYGVYDTVGVSSGGGASGAKYPGFSIARRLPKHGSSASLPQWSFPQPIVIDSFYNRAKKYYAHLAPDNRTLLLALERNDSRGGLDLYVSFRRDTSLSWTAPLHLGNRINTEKYEGSPFLAADGKTLYFSSEGLDGIGSTDLFMARRLDDSWQHWSEPVNLGAEINSLEEDSSIDLLPDGRRIYYLSSTADEGKGLYTALLPDTLQPLSSLVLKGYVRLQQPAKEADKHLAGSSPQAFPRDILVAAYRMSRDVHAKPRLTLAALSQVWLDNERTPKAQYALALPAGETFVVKASAPGYERHFSSAYMLLPTNPAKHVEIRAKDFVLGGTFDERLGTVMFAQDSAELDSISEATSVLLASAALALETERSAFSEESSTRLELLGRTCDLGTDAENTALGLRRAEAVAAVLRQYGIPAERITVSSLGEKKPLVSSATGLSREEVRKRNRCVEVVLRRK